METNLKSLYDQDFNLWIEETVSQLKSKEFNEVDWENLIDEVESLAKQDKRELKSRLTTLFEHGLKRHFILLPDCYRGWGITIHRTQGDIEDILEDSPSLRHYLLEVWDKCYQKAVKNMRMEYEASFPDVCPFSVEQVLNGDFSII